MGYNWAKEAMENKSKELQNRREFFKEAARKALPILGVVTLMSNPIISNAMQQEKTGCDYGCSYTCSGSCTSACTGGCSGGCTGGCTGCTGSCSGSCTASSY